MNCIIKSLSRLRGLSHVGSFPSGNLGFSGFSPLRSFSSLVPRATWESPSYRCGSIVSQAEGRGVFQQPPCNYQQIRTKKRGTEYQPKNIKRKRTHGWIKRMSTRSGIEVILRRMLKGRKSLTH